MKPSEARSISPVETDRSEPTRFDSLVSRVASLLGLPRHVLESDAEPQLVPQSVPDREDLARQRATSLASRDERGRERSEREAQIRARIADAERAAAVAGAELVAVVAEHTMAGLAEDREVRRLELELRDSADGRIGDFVREIRDELEAVRRTGVVVHETKNPFTEGRRLSSNGESVNARLVALQEALRQAEELELLALAADDVAARLDSLRASLPEAEGLEIEPLKV
jgi:hypothetical protein